MQSLKQSATIPPLLENPCKSHLPSSLNYSFSIYNVEPTPKVYDFIIKTSFKPLKFHHISSVLDHLEKVENFEPPESIFDYLIEFYGITDKNQEAIELFCRIPKFRCVPSVYSLNTLMPVLCRSSKGLNLVPEILLNSQVMNTRMEESTFQKEATKFEVLAFLEELRKLGFCPGMVEDFVLEWWIIVMLLETSVVKHLNCLRKWLVRMSPGVRDWKALLLDSGFKLGFIETTLFSLVDTIQTQLSCENVAVDASQIYHRVHFSLR
ncbi:hypothetical protein NC652_037014 [Populus alba x Populus x berolinensis]|nr:hypothetical protein NC652_037011 [Populus alba x Populus x berolinensis]KAJ6871527.1 hypothetical protein NC652_037014 [Populus alba x Populus x berolinensis]